MSSLVLELQSDTLNSAVSTLDVLRKALVVAKKLGIEKFQKWIELELKGYYGVSVPTYRFTRGQLRAWNPYHGWQPIQVESKEIQKIFADLCECPINQPISELVSLVKTEENELIMQLPYELESHILRFVKTSVKISISKVSVEGVIEAVRDIILDWALQLEKNGVMGEGMTFSNNEKQIAANHDFSSLIQISLGQSQMQNSSSESQSKAENFSNNISSLSGGNVNNIQGTNIQAAQGNEIQAVIGDGNLVKQTAEGNMHGVENLTQADVIQLLTELESLIKETELPAETKAEVIEDLSAAKTATDREEPNKKRALDRLTSVAETLEKTSKGLDAGQKIWQTAKPVLIKVATWLGAAAGSHFFGL
jgi:AbiTii